MSRDISTFGRPKGPGGARVLLQSILLCGLLAFSSSTFGCSKEEDASWARAKRITTRAEVIGGPGTLADVGDYLLENDKIRVIVQGKDFSRGFGVYGGGLIDADLQRPLGPGGQLGRDGQSQFGEMFPVFFLQALVPYSVSVLSDGSDGRPAQVVSLGEGGDFLTMTKTLNQVILNSHEIDGNILDPRTLEGPANIVYETIYELAPGVPYVTMTNRMTNISGKDLPIPSPTAQVLLNMLFDDLGEFDVPMGTVLLFGDGNKVFTPGAGFDMRFALQDSYKADLSFPALPGIITPILATASKDGVSYALFPEPMGPGENFVQGRFGDEGQNVYEEAYDIEVGPDSMLVPFLASAFTGVFTAQAPRMLERDESFEFKSYFAIGNGDVASVMEPYFQLRDVELGKVRGRVFDEISLAPVDGASIVVLDEDGKPFSQMYSRAQGRFAGRLPAGSYSAVVEHDPVLSGPTPFTVTAGETSMIDLARPSPASVAVSVFDEASQRLPARIIVVASVDAENAGRPTREWLFDLTLGQRWRESSMVSEDPEIGAPVRYIEGEAFTRDGVATVDVRPGGPYTVYVARGNEYDVERIEIAELKAGTISAHDATLRRTVNTSGWLNSDLHLHASPSLDSDLDLTARVVSAAGEGLEYIVASDHNIITDYAPYILKAGLERWLTSSPGLELTTLEAGHFNAFPLRYDAGDVVRGSPEWALRTPGDIFAALRALGKYSPEETIIQVNHPRDSILGYFAQYGLDPMTALIPDPDTLGGLDLLMLPSGPAFYDEAGKSTFSFDFDAIEVLNGKRIDQLRSFRMPEDISQFDLDPEVVEQLPEPGTVLCNTSGKVAWPGAIDDWFNFLNQGMRFTVVGNSDSHEDTQGSIGSARTFIWVGHDDPFNVHELEVVEGLMNHRAVLTNGPFVELFVDGAPIGSEIVSETGEVEVMVRVQVPNWIEVDQATLYVNGRPADRFLVTPRNGKFEVTIRLTLEQDSWMVVELTGTRQLFPLYPPIEVPPVELNDAFASIAEPFGFGGGPFGEMLPKRMGVVTPYALTNPIWVDLGGDGWTPPGLPHRECVGFALVEDWDTRVHKSARRPVRSAEDMLVPSYWFPRVRGDITDIRSYIEQFRE